MQPVNTNFIPQEGLETEEMNQLQREIALQFADEYKLPRPTYEADKYVDELKEDLV